MPLRFAGFLWSRPIAGDIIPMALLMIVRLAHDWVIPWTAEWILGFPTAGLLLEIFYIDADRKGLLIGGLFYAEIQNMPGGCIPTPHYPLMELLASGLLIHPDGGIA